MQGHRSSAQRPAGHSRGMLATAAMRSIVNPDAVPLEVFLYADGAEARSRKHHYHPLLLFLGNFTLDAMRSQRGYVMAHMSVLAKEDFPQVSDKETLPLVGWCLSLIVVI